MRHAFSVRVVQKREAGRLARRRRTRASQAACTRGARGHSAAALPVCRACRALPCRRGAPPGPRCPPRRARRAPPRPLQQRHVSGRGSGSSGGYVSAVGESFCELVNLQLYLLLLAHPAHTLRPESAACGDHSSSPGGPGGPGGPSMMPVGNASPFSVVVKPRSPLSPLSPWGRRREHELRDAYDR